MFFNLLSDFSSYFASVFVVVDPFAVVPIFLSITEKYTAHDRELISRKAGIISTVMLLVFAYSGMAIFNLFWIFLPAFQIAGGILRLLLGWEQLNAARRRVRAEEETESMDRDDIYIFPLAMPLLAGPGAISTVVLLASKIESWQGYAVLTVAILMAMLATYMTLRMAPLLRRLLHQTGLNLITRIMGVLLTAIAVQFIINGVTAVVKLLGFAVP